MWMTRALMAGAEFISVAILAALATYAIGVALGVGV